MNNNSSNLIAFLFIYSCLMMTLKQGHQQRFRVPVKKNFAPPPQQGRTR